METRKISYGKLRDPFLGKHINSNLFSGLFRISGKHTCTRWMKISNVMCTHNEKRMRKLAYDTRMRRSLTKDWERCNKNDENELEKRCIKSECIHDLLGLIQVAFSLSISKETPFLYRHSCLLYFMFFLIVSNLL